MGAAITGSEPSSVNVCSFDLNFGTGGNPYFALQSIASLNPNSSSVSLLPRGSGGELENCKTAKATFSHRRYNIVPWHDGRQEMANKEAI